MSSLNKMLLIGRLGKDPEQRFSADGWSVVTISVATEERYKDKAGEQQKKTDWHRCVAFGKTGELINEYCRKGSLVYIEGRLSTRKWTDKAQTVRYTTEVVVDRVQFLGGSGSGERAEKAQAEPEKRESAPAKAAQPGGFEQMDDDIPFSNPYRGRLCYVI